MSSWITNHDTLSRTPNKVVLFMSPWGVSYTPVSKSEWTFTQRIGASFSVCMKINFYCERLRVMIEGNIYTPWCPRIE